MLSTDKYHTGWEEVHISGACSTPTSLAPELIGCMDKGALNYKPGARQGPLGTSAVLCRYSNLGCMDSTKLNYNSEATVDDGSCVSLQCGCSVMGSNTGSSYADVDSKTPGYESLWVAKPLPNVGIIGWPTHAGVMTYDSTATVLGGRVCNNVFQCKFITEGCMSTTAINYNSQATTNSNTWCVEPVPGCMMPPYHAANDQTAMSGRHKGRFGLAAIYDLSHLPAEDSNNNYNPLATVAAGCTVEILGCMKPEMLNYDSRATKNFMCYESKFGCLNPAAKNFNCSAERMDSDSSCSDGVTQHNWRLCKFYARPTLSAPVTANPEIVMITEGDVKDYKVADTVAIATECAKGVGLSAGDVTVTTAPGSVIWTITYPLLTEAQFAQFKVFEDALLSSVEGSQILFDAAGVDATVESVSVTTNEFDSFPPPSAPPSADVGLIVGLVVAGILVLLILVFVIMFMRKKKSNSNVAPQ